MDGWLLQLFLSSSAPLVVANAPLTHSFSILSTSLFLQTSLHLQTKPDLDEVSLATVSGHICKKFYVKCSRH